MVFFIFIFISRLIVVNVLLKGTLKADEVYGQDWKLKKKVGEGNKVSESRFATILE